MRASPRTGRASLVDLAALCEYGVVGLGVAAILAAKIEWSTTLVLTPLVLLLCACAAAGAVWQQCRPRALRRHWLGFILAGLALFCHTATVAPERCIDVMAGSLLALYLVGGLATTLRIRRDEVLALENRRCALLVLWSLPVLGFWVVSAYYHHLDEPRENDRFQARFESLNESGGDSPGPDDAFTLLLARGFWSRGRTR